MPTATLRRLLAPLAVAVALALAAGPAAAEVRTVDRGAMTTLIKQQKGLVFVEFSASWCINCRLVSRYLAALEARHPGVAAADFDAGRSMTAFARYDLEALPTVLVFRDGREVARHVGVPSEEWLETTVARLQSVPPATVLAQATGGDGNGGGAGGAMAGRGALAP